LGQLGRTISKPFKSFQNFEFTGSTVRELTVIRVAIVEDRREIRDSLRALMVITGDSKRWSAEAPRCPPELAGLL